MIVNEYLSINVGGFVGIGLTFFWNPRYAGNRGGKKKIYLHLLFVQFAFSWGGKRKGSHAPKFEDINYGKS